MLILAHSAAPSMIDKIQDGVYTIDREAPQNSGCPPVKSEVKTANFGRVSGLYFFFTA